MQGESISLPSILSMFQMDKESFIYKFLLSPKFRKWRYLLLFSFFLSTSLNQVVVGYKELIPQMGKDIFWITAADILVFVVGIIWLLKVVRSYLLTGKYILFILCIVLAALLFLIPANIVYFLYEENYNLLSEEVMLDNLSTYVIYLLCITGIFIPVFLKNWLISNQELHELEIKQELSQVEQFKDQINPASFFRILNSSKSYVKAEPDRASAMLRKLGQLLRYQLYDSNREEVFLAAEISFLRNFLDLEKLYNPKFDYKLNVQSNLMGILISPSILLPFTQNIINTYDKKKEERLVEIEINILDEAILVLLKMTGSINNIPLQNELLKIKKRLNALYKKNYALDISTDKVEGLEVMLTLNKQ